MLTNLLRDKSIAPKLVPIIPDEARTFGMEGFFQKIGIYAHEGQKYEPVDSEQLSSYKEDKKGQVLKKELPRQALCHLGLQQALHTQIMIWK
jgi:pyruvate dehydrogenase E1 component